MVTAACLLTSDFVLYRLSKIRQHFRSQITTRLIMITRPSPCTGQTWYLPTQHYFPSTTTRQHIRAKIKAGNLTLSQDLPVYRFCTFRLDPLAFFECAINIIYHPWDIILITRSFKNTKHFSTYPLSWKQPHELLVNHMLEAKQRCLLTVFLAL